MLYCFNGKNTMKPQRKNNHGTQVAILMLASMSWGTAWGGILDFFKSPASLIMNQKHCSYMSKMPGETLNGRFIFSPGQGVVVVIMSMEQLDDNRVVAKTEQNEDR
jgi:hypothetical protein